MAGGNYDRSHKNSQLNPAVAYSFALQVEAAFFIPLRSVHVFTKENEFEYYQEGGLNDYVHMLRKPITKPFTFQVERYVGTDAGFFDLNSGFLDPLSLGTDLVLPVVLYVNRSPAGDWYKNISFTNCARAYIFTGCTVIAKEYGELNAEQSRLHTETITIAYRELMAMNQISAGWEKGEKWKYDGTVKGGGEEHTGNRNKNTAAKPSKWVYPGSREYQDLEAEREEKEKKKKPISRMLEQLFPDLKKKQEEIGQSHTANRSQNTVNQPSKWVFPGSSEQRQIDAERMNAVQNNPNLTFESIGEGDSHTLNRSTNTVNEPSKWIFPGSREQQSIDAERLREVQNNPNLTFESIGEGDSHLLNRSRNTTNPPSKWNFPGTNEENVSVDHTINRSVNTAAQPSKWNYPGSDEGGKSVDHMANRNNNEKAEPVKYPPKRRALMAQALSEL